MRVPPAPLAAHPSTRGRSAMQRRPVRPDDLRVPRRGVLRGAGAGGVVAVDEAEALFVALGPFEVVDEGPVEVALDGGAAVNRPLELAEVALGEVDARRVVDVAVERDAVGRGDAVLGDDDRFAVALVA